MEIDIKTPAKELIPINTNIGDFISRVVSALLIVAALATFIYLVYGGLSWIMSGGDKAKVQEARDRITNAVIGLGIVATAWAIFLLIDYFFGIGITG